MTIGERIKSVRKEKKMTQEQLASFLGVKTAAVSKYENNLVSPSWDTVIKIADALCVKLDDIASGIDYPARKQEDILQEISNPLNIKLYREQMLIAFDMLNPYGKKTAMQRVEELTQIEKYTKADPAAGSDPE